MTSPLIIIDYRGQVTHESMEEQLLLLRNHPLLENLRKVVRKRLYGTLVELMDNIRKYAAGETDASVRVEKEGDQFLIKASNLLTLEQEAMLGCRLGQVNSLNPEELRELYEKVINKEGKESDTGAGLGLITMALRSEGPLHYSFEPGGDGHRLYKIWIYLKT